MSNDLLIVKRLVPGASNYSIETTGVIYNNLSGKALKPYYHNRSARVKILNDAGEIVNINIARLVAECFVKNSNPEQNIVVGHRDGDIKNNDASNLFWTTKSEIMGLEYNKVKLENRRRSSDVPVRIYNLRTQEIEEFYTIKEAAIFLNCCTSTISRVLSGKQITFKDWMIEKIK